jgi:hypothetical protein
LYDELLSRQAILVAEEARTQSEELGLQVEANQVCGQGAVVH